MSKPASRSLPSGFALLACWAGLVSTPSGADDKADPPAVAAAFHELDRDRDGRLSLEEYLERTGNRQRLERDFRVFDFDGDRFLTEAEFAAVPGLVPPSRRGPLHDPFDDLLAAAVEAMDEAYDDWSRQPQRTVPAQGFVTTYLESLSPGFRVDAQELRDLMQLADPDGNGQVTRAEARRFLEIQLGIRWKTGHLLRQPNGRILMVRHFLSVDSDNDGLLTLEEFLDSGLFTWTGEDLQDLFRRGDLDGDGVITLDEYAHPDWAGYQDPVTMFLRWDTNFDGLLDEEELQELPDYLERLAPSMLPAFDLDGDGKLSLDEFRLSMIGHRFVNWSVPTDTDRDRHLSFEEFTFRQAQCHLLRRLYFHQLDLDGDGKLSQDEYFFNVRTPNGFHLLAADGSEFRQIYANEDYPNCGSPDFSPDGRTIAFDGYRGGETIRSSRILLINSDGSGFRDLCEGLMPTWSRDGRQLACSRYRGGSGVWIINADGSDERRIDDGWGAQWSPDGKTIAYTKTSLWAYDVDERKSREVLPRGGHPVQSIYWNSNWSPDSSRLAFKASTPQGNALASVSMTGEDPDLKIHFTTEQNFDADISWTPDGRRIMFTMTTEGFRGRRLYELDADSDDPPRMIDGTDPDLSYMGGVTFTRDGKGMVICTRE